MLKKWVCLMLAIGASVAAWAQVQLTASVDKNTLTLDDELTLTVRVSGVSGNLIMPQLPSLPAFNVYSREVDQSTINGHTTLQFHYVMLPRFVGNATIGPVRFTYQNKTYQSQPIEVQIYRNAPSVPVSKPTHQTNQKADPSLPPLEAALANQAYAHSGEPFFLVAAVSNKTPYANEAITLAVRFYYSRAFYDAPYQKPSASNVFIEDMGSSEGTQSIGGVQYRYQEQRYQLTAAAPGKAVIGPASVRYHTGSSPFSAFDRLFGGAAISPEKTVESAPITLNVRAVPAQNQPGSFYGAVGSHYTLTAQAEPQQVEAGEAVNVRIRIQGTGNLKATRDMTFPALEGFKMYPSAPQSGQQTATNGTLQSYKEFKAVLVPVSSGIYTIPAFAWSYFNPQTQAYTTLHTAPITLTVSPASKTESAINFAATSTSQHNGFQALTNDITYLKSTPAPEPLWLAKLADCAWLNWLVLTGLGLCVLFASFGRKTLNQQKPFLTAKAHLKKATTPAAVADILSNYLYQRYHVQTGSLPLKAILHTLAQKGVSPATRDSFATLWQALEAARFAPAQAAAQQGADAISRANQLLRRLEEERK